MLVVLWICVLESEFVRMPETLSTLSIGLIYLKPACVNDVLFELELLFLSKWDGSGIVGVLLGPELVRIIELNWSGEACSSDFKKEFDFLNMHRSVRFLKYIFHN